jgi:hypothetical protein
MREIMTADALMSRHTSAWQAAIVHPFLAGVRDGSLPEQSFDRWLAQDYLFAQALVRAQARIAATAPLADVAHLAGGVVATVGELSVFDDGPRTASATALTELRAVSLDRETLRGWMADRPEVAEQLLRVLARRLRRTNKLTDQIFTDVPALVAKQLLLLAQQFGTREDDGLRVAHDLTQMEIAQLVGASRESTNQALRTFADRGWIQSESDNTLILDAESLARRAR